MINPLIHHRVLFMLILAILAGLSNLPACAQSTPTPPGSELAWMNYLGGSSSEEALDIALDKEGNAYLTGYTFSIGWTQGDLGSGWKGKRDAFVAQISSSGEHTWSICLGGAESDQGNAIAIDPAGNIYVAGWTDSIGWAPGGGDTSHNGDRDGFALKLNSAGKVLWGTYLGGNRGDSINDIALDPDGDLLVTGNTSSAGWVSGGYDSSYGGGERGLGKGDAFVAKISSQGMILWSTYYGEDKMEEDVQGIVVDQSGNSILVSNIIIWSIDVQIPQGGYLAKISPEGKLVWNRPWDNITTPNLGGTIWPKAIAIDQSDNIYLAGYTGLAGWTSGGFDTTYAGGDDAFVAKLNPEGQILWSTYLGGAG